ncbi:MFS transporter [Lactobacillus sp. XV13L]|nr:MFS transporter [Lactobacillus sp. XV13L]
MIEKKSYLTSRLFCGLGNSLYGLVFTWWLQVQTNSSTVVGIANAIFSVTAALAIFYGPFIDNHSYKKTSIYAMVIQVALTFLLTAVIVFMTHNYVLAIVIAGLLSICDEFFGPADRALLKGAVPDEGAMTSIISKVNIIDQVVSIAGTALSGVLLVLITSGQVILLCGCLSLVGLFFLIRALKHVPVQNHDQEAAQFDAANYWQHAISGYRYIRKNSFLKRYFWSSLLYSFAAPAMILILPRVAQKAGKASWYSTFYIVLMLGFILGALFSGRMAAKSKTVAWTWILSALPLGLLLFCGTNLIAFAVLVFLFAMVTSVHNILGESRQQTATADRYLGRVLTTIRTGTQVGGPVGSIAAGLLLDHAGAQPLIIICCVLVLLGGLNMLLVKED